MGKRGKLPKSDLPIAPSCVPYKRTQSDIDRERRYKAEDALRTLSQAEKYKSDKQLMGDVKRLAQEQMNDLKKIK